MSSEQEIINDLVKRLLAGERGELPFSVAMLLERSSPLDSGDEYYQSALPTELTSIRLSAERAQEITDAICAAIAKNPDQQLIFAVSFSGADEVTKILATVVANPPRQLSMSEMGSALAVLATFLPWRLGENPVFLATEQVIRLFNIAKDLQALDEGGEDRAARIYTKGHAARLFKSLTELGILSRKSEL